MRVGRAPTGKFRGLVSMNERSYSIDRKTAADTQQYGAGTQDSEYATDHHTASLYLFLPEERRVETTTGEDVRGDLQGFALPGTDIQPQDRLDYAGVRYEVLTIVGVPNERDPTVLDVRLTRLEQ